MPDLRSWEEDLFDEGGDEDAIIAALVVVPGIPDPDEYGRVRLTCRDADLDGTAVHVFVDKAHPDGIFCFAEGKATFGTDGIEDAGGIIDFDLPVNTLVNADDGAIYVSTALPFRVDYVLDDTGTPDYPATAQLIVDTTWETLAHFMEWVDDTNRQLDQECSIRED